MTKKGGHYLECIFWECEEIIPHTFETYHLDILGNTNKETGSGIRKKCYSKYLTLPKIRLSDFTPFQNFILFNIISY